MVKVYIEADERYPHYFFYPDEDGWIPEYYKDSPKCIDISVEVLERMKYIRDEEIKLQDTLKELASSVRHRG